MQRMAIKGVMLDMARVTERHDYYNALPDRLASWGYNTVFAHFTDDEGCAMHFNRRSELATPHAFSQDQMRRWIARCRQAGLSVIPEIESFGHAKYIFTHKKYAHLHDPGVGGNYHALNPLHPESKALLADLIEETAAVFDAPFIHAGLDEVNFGASPEVKEALKTRQKWEIFAGHVEFMRSLIARTGRRMMMWGDHLLKQPRIADRISRDIVICNWHYQPDVSSTTVEFFTSRGFEVIGCPASARSGDIVLPNWITQINLQRFARICHAGGDKVVGLMNTIWCPMRMLCGIEQFAMALGGAWFNDPEESPEKIVARFVRGHFGLDRPGRVPAAILRLSHVTPTRVALQRFMDSDQEPAGALTACEGRKAADLLTEVSRVAKTLTAARRSVRLNRKDFDALLLACDVLGWIGRAGIARGGDRKAERRILSEGKRLIKRCQADWNRGRYADDPTRDLDGKPGRWPEALIPNLHLAVSRLVQRAAR